MVKPFRTCQALLLKGAMEPDTIAPSLSFYNRNKSLKIPCFWAEIKKNTRLLQKRKLKKIQLSILFRIFAPVYSPLTMTPIEVGGVIGLDTT